MGIAVPAYRWAKTVKKLDNWTCAFCGSTQYLEAHHIQPRTTNPELQTDLENGITLCHECHYAAHGGGYMTTKHVYAIKKFAVDPALVQNFIQDYVDTRIILAIPHNMVNTIKTHAEQRGESLNGFINRAIENQIEQDRKGGVPT